MLAAFLRYLAVFTMTRHRNRCPSEVRAHGRVIWSARDGSRHCQQASSVRADCAKWISESCSDPSQVDRTAAEDNAVASLATPLSSSSRKYAHSLVSCPSGMTKDLAAGEPSLLGPRVATSPVSSTTTNDLYCDGRGEAFLVNDHCPNIDFESFG